MKAFILAAGLGTRLGELTKDKPKALVCVNGKPMLQLLLENLIKQGFDKFLINIHYHGDKITKFLADNKNFGVDIEISDERQKLLDTGGAIKKAAGFFKGSELVLVHNVDVFTDLNFSDFIENHKKSEALITLFVRNRNSSRKLLFDDGFNLKGWQNLKTGDYKWVDEPLKNYVERAYSGIYIASQEYPVKIKSEGSFPVVSQWLSLAKTEKITGVEHNDSLWFDLGTKEKIEEAERVINKKSRE